MSLTLVAALVIVWLLAYTSPVALGVAVGVGGLVCVAQLRAFLPPWAQWTAVGLSAALAVTCGLVAWLSWRADQERRAADERARHEYTVAEMRPRQPLAVLHLVMKAIHENDPALVCFVFAAEAEREFAEAANTDTCPAAITALHGRITGKGYGNATADPDDVTHETRDRPATVAGCRMYIVDGPGEYRDPPGPQLGTFRLERDPRFPNSGYLITRYTPCGETVRRLTRRQIAPSGGRGSEGGDLGATRLTWTGNREGTTAWRESAGRSEGVEGVVVQGPRDRAKAILLEAKFPAVQPHTLRHDA